MDTKQKTMRLQYDRGNLQKAYDATRDGMSVYQAARRYLVPESTLRDRTRGNVAINASIGFDAIFTREQEEMLHSHINYMANIGYGYNKLGVQSLAREYALSLNKNLKSSNALSNSWFYGFLRRWPDLSVKTAQKLTFSRAQSASHEKLNNYYKELSSLMTKHNLTNRPDRIYNIDETGIHTQHKPLKIVCSIDTKAQAVTSEKSSLTTIICAGNAAGNHIPPYYVFKGKRWNGDLLNRGLPGAEGEMSETGWSNSLVFHNYLTKFFVKHVNVKDHNNAPLLILFDGHKSHINLTLTNWAKKLNILLFVLPPHTSHLTQPLDVVIFAPLKSMYNKECDAYLKANPGVNISKHQTAELTAKPYLKALSAENLVSAFRKTGIFPFNNKAITDKDVAPASIYKPAEEELPSTEEVTVAVVEVSASITPGDTTTAADSSLSNDGLGAPEEQQNRKSDPSTFFSDRAITRVVKKPKRKFVPPFLSGNLLKQSNINTLKPIIQKTTEKSKMIKKSLKLSDPTPVKQRKQHSDPRPSISGTNKKGAPLYLTSEDGDSSMDDDNDDDEKCCVCGKFQPDELRRCTSVVFTKWAKCDVCDHWTHLICCTDIRVIRRGDDFRCPHCKN